MGLVHVAQDIVFSGGYQFSAEVMAAGDVAGGQVLFIVPVHVNNSLAVLYLLHAVSVADVHMKIELEGWELDTQTTELDEKS